jgi:hypothetical protein
VPQVARRRRRPIAVDGGAIAIAVEPASDSRRTADGHDRAEIDARRY